MVTSECQGGTNGAEGPSQKGKRRHRLRPGGGRKRRRHLAEIYRQKVEIYRVEMVDIYRETVDIYIQNVDIYNWKPMKTIGNPQSPLTRKKKRGLV